VVIKEILSHLDTKRRLYGILPAAVLWGATAGGCVLNPPLTPTLTAAATSMGAAGQRLAQRSE